MALIRCAAGALILSFALAASAAPETLPRRLEYGWSLQDPAAGTSGAKVRRLGPGGPAEAAGVRAGDVVLAVGAIQVDSVGSLAALRFAGVAGAPLPVRLQRGADRVDVQLTPGSAPRETYADIETEWGEVVGAGGARLRTIATIPRGGGRLPAIFIAGWLSCDSVEVPPARMEPTDQLIRDLITQKRRDRLPRRQARLGRQRRRVRDDRLRDGTHRLPARIRVDAEDIRASIRDASSSSASATAADSRRWSRAARRCWAT